MPVAPQRAAARTVVTDGQMWVTGASPMTQESDDSGSRSALRLQRRRRALAASLGHLCWLRARGRHARLGGARPPARRWRAAAHLPAQPVGQRALAVDSARPRRRAGGHGHDRRHDACWRGDSPGRSRAWRAICLAIERTSGRKSSTFATRAVAAPSSASSRRSKSSRKTSRKTLASLIRQSVSRRRS